MAKVARRLGIDTKETGLLCANWGVSIMQGAARPTALTEGTPPLKIYSNGEIDLEFGPLLVVDYIVMDEDAYYRLQNDKRSPVLDRLRTTLRTLYGEGFLRLSNYGAVLSRDRQWIIDTSSEHASTPERWIDALRLAVSGWERARESFRHVIEPSLYDMAMHIPYGIFACLCDTGRTIDETSYQAVRRLIFSDSKRLRTANRGLLESCLKPYLNHVFSCMAIRNELDLPLVDWENLRPFYVPLHQRLGPNKPQPEQRQDKVRELFECALPDYEPVSVTELLRLLNDRRVKALREYIRTAVIQKHPLNAAEIQEAMLDLRQLGSKMNRKSGLLNLTGLGVGVTLTAAGIPPTASAAAAVGMFAVQEFAQRSAAYSLERGRDWLYLLMDNKARRTIPSQK